MYLSLDRRVYGFFLWCCANQLAAAVPSGQAITKLPPLKTPENMQSYCSLLTCFLSSTESSPSRGRPVSLTHSKRCRWQCRQSVLFEGGASLMLLLP